MIKKAPSRLDMDKTYLCKGAGSRWTTVLLDTWEQSNAIHCTWPLYAWQRPILDHSSIAIVRMSQKRAYVAEFSPSWWGQFPCWRQSGTGKEGHPIWREALSCLPEILFVDCHVIVVLTSPTSYHLLQVPHKLKIPHRPNNNFPRIPRHLRNSS